MGYVNVHGITGQADARCDWCPKCKKRVEPKVPDALPNATLGNRSQRGADCQAVLMSVFRTLKQRGHDPIRTITNALATYIKTGKLPPLPENILSGG